MNYAWHASQYNFMNESANNNTNDEMRISFEEFFHAIPNDTLSMAYFLTDLADHKWNQSRFVQNMINNTDLFADIINRTPGQGSS
uniref:Uncharacterized protein n=1 Tax=Acrobeloides nanus TaxID=290746 RepID=A0A914DVW7_9BILA